MNILGIDLGTNKLAYTHITGPRDIPIYVTIVYAVPKTVKEPSEKFIHMVDILLAVMHEKQPELLVVEYPFNIMGNAKVLLEMFGIIRYRAVKKGFNFLPISQSMIKKYATGHGDAEKSDMRMQAYKEFNQDLSEDGADSFWIANIGMTTLYGSDKKWRQESIDRMQRVKPKKKRKKE